MIRLAAAFITTVVTGAYATNEVGTKFLEEVSKKKDVITLDSGLRYKVLKKGEGWYSPYAETSCEVHYAGTTPSLTPNATEIEESEWNEFDSSYKRGSPTSFAPNQVIKGWTEAMQLMREGDKWEMYIPSELGYGEGGSGDKIKGGDVLIFRMEILKVMGNKKKRVVKQDFSAGIGISDEEKKAWEKWGKEDKKTIQAEVEKLTKESQKTHKKGKVDAILKELKMMKTMLKGKKLEEKKAKKGKKEEL